MKMPPRQSASAANSLPHADYCGTVLHAFILLQPINIFIGTTVVMKLFYLHLFNKRSRFTPILPKPPQTQNNLIGSVVLVLRSK